MIIDGKRISKDILSNLKERIAILKKNGVQPHLAVILVGEDPSSISYVRRKEKTGEELGIRISIFRFHSCVSKEEVFSLIERLNQNENIHGIIIQRPFPLNINKEALNRLVVPSKDVDGFHPNSRFTPPIALAILKILEWVQKDSTKSELFSNWLGQKKILVIGRGDTGGKPIARILQSRGAKINVAHSKTSRLKGICLNSDIIISCVGQKKIIQKNIENDNYPYILRHQMLLSRHILIGVGIQTVNGRLKTDYNQEEVKDLVAYYTPVPGGVGPVNVASLMENVVRGAESAD